MSGSSDLNVQVNSTASTCTRLILSAEEEQQQEVEKEEEEKRLLCT